MSVVPNICSLINWTNQTYSKWCNDNFPGAYWKPKGKWWDGYTGQSTVIVDDFYGWIPLDDFLRITDRYPLLAEIKGSVAQFTARTIIFTSNIPWLQWYKTWHPEHIAAFDRRVDEEYHFTNRLQPDGKDIVVVDKKDEDGVYQTIIIDNEIQW